MHVDSVTSRNASDIIIVTSYIEKQAAQVSQRGRATLCVIEYFAKSLKVI